jgi:chromosome segregation ATPase
LDTLCREDSIARERAAWSSECDVLRTALSSSTKALSEELVASVDKLNAQCGTLEADVSSGTATLKDSLATLSSSIAAEQEERRKQLGEMQATAAASAAELERSTSARLDESAAGVQSACAKMNADIAQTAEDVLAIRTVMDAKIERECEALGASLQRATQGFGDRLGSFQDEINGQVVVRLDDFDSKLGGMQKRLAPCEDKLLEVALKAEVKAQTMLMEMRVAEVSRLLLILVLILTLAKSPQPRCRSACPVLPCPSLSYHVLPCPEWIEPV